MTKISCVRNVNFVVKYAHIHILTSLTFKDRVGRKAEMFAQASFKSFTWFRTHLLFLEFFVLKPPRLMGADFAYFLLECKIILSHCRWCIREILVIAAADHHHFLI